MKKYNPRVKDLPDDLTPFITRTTQDHISGGAFGDVWKCECNADGISALVAVKAFRCSGRDDAEKINRKIRREIGILKILRHNNIVPLLGTATGFGPRPELRCLVTPWIPNGTLNAYLASYHNDLTMLDRSYMLEDISAGLHYLHSVPVVHGDITGANVLIDEGGHARLIDFGLSTIIRPLLGQSYLVATSMHPGAIRYAAPELVLSDDSGDVPSEKPDIYSFGCVMLQILSGRHPWSEVKSEKPELRIIIMISQGHCPERPDSHPAIVDSDWDIIQKCLQSKPTLRPSADEVLDLVMHRLSSSDSSSPPGDPPNDAQSGFPGVSPQDDFDGSDTTEQSPDSPPPHPDHELMNQVQPHVHQQIVHNNGHVAFQYSKCSGRKKALCIGINYRGQRLELRGCINDVYNVRRFLTSDWGYRAGDIVTLVDDTNDSRQMPTRQNILDAMRWLVHDACPHDSLFFHYSGYGGQVQDMDGDKVNGLDEVIYPVDHKKAGIILDHEMHHIMVKSLPTGCRLTAIFDSCHSQTALTLPYIYQSNGRLKESHITPQYRALNATSADVISFAGCQASVDMDMTQGGMVMGAMSYAFVTALAREPVQSYQELLKSVRDILKQDYQQRPQLSSSHPIDTSLRIIL